MTVAIVDHPNVCLNHNVHSIPNVVGIIQTKIYGAAMRVHCTIVVSYSPIRIVPSKGGFWSNRKQVMWFGGSKYCLDILPDTLHGTLAAQRAYYHAGNQSTETADNDCAASRQLQRYLPGKVNCSPIMPTCLLRRLSLQ